MAKQRIDLLKVAASVEAKALEAGLEPGSEERCEVFPEAFAASGVNVPAPMVSQVRVPGSKS